MPNSLVLVERSNDVATLTFNDPDRLNAMTRAMGEAFSTAIAPLRDDPALRCVVLTGAGRAFSAGGDLSMIDEQGDYLIEDLPEGTYLLRKDSWKSEPINLSAGEQTRIDIPLEEPEEEEEAKKEQ